MLPYQGPTCSVGAMPLIAGFLFCNILWIVLAALPNG